MAGKGHSFSKWWSQDGFSHALEAVQWSSRSSFNILQDEKRPDGVGSGQMSSQYIIQKVMKRKAEGTKEKAVPN